MRSAILAIATVIFLSGCNDAPELKPLDRFPGPWRDLDTPVLQTMQQDVGALQNCRTALMRPSAKTKGEYLVYCTRSFLDKHDPNRRWEAYLIYPATAKVVGLSKTFKDVLPPE